VSGCIAAFGMSVVLAAASGPAAETRPAAPVTVRHAGAPAKPAVFDVGDTIEVVVATHGVPAGGTVTARWFDSYERLVARQTARTGAARSVTFRFPVRACVSTGNRMAVLLDGKPLGKAVAFGCAPQHTRPLRDWYVFPWAQYPAGTGDTLRSVGVNGGMAYRRKPFGALVANDLRFYVDQMAWPIFSFYKKNQRAFRKQMDAFRKEWDEKGVANTSHLVRTECLSDPETMKRLRTMLQDHVRPHAPYKPTWYNMQDEGGMAAQNQRNEFCFGPHCLAGLRTWLKGQYGSLAALNAAWGTGFKTFNDVVPMTSYEIRRREKDVPLATKRLGPWCDHRAYMDIVMTRALAKARAFCREIDPDGLFGITGTQWPDPWPGFDYSLLPTAVDIAHYYDYGNAIEIARSFHPRHGSRLFPYPGWSRGNDRIRQDWYYLFHGLSCTGIWDQKKELLHADGRPTMKVLQLKDTWLELQRGIGRLFINAKRDNDPIAIHFSQPSRRVRAMAYDDPVLKGVSFSWDDTGAIRAIEDLGFQYEFVAYGEVERGFLDTGRFRLFFLLNTIALSQREAEAIEAWVKRSGVLVTDGRAGLLDEHGRGRAAPALAHLTAGRPAGRSAAFDVFERGRGRVVLLKDVPLAQYAKERFKGGDSLAPVKDALGRVLGLAGLKARVPVLDEKGRPVHGVETVLFTDGHARYVAILRNPGYDGWLRRRVDKMYGYAFAQPADVTVRFDGAAHVYKMRAGTYLGKVKTDTATLEPWEPLCYALMPYRVTGVAIDCPPTARRGDTVPVRLAVKTDGAPAGHHVLRVDVLRPDGSLRTCYSRNLETNGGSGKMTIPLALNDAIGTWRLRVRDIATATTGERTFEVTAAQLSTAVRTSCPEER